ncbi:hypothetical protein Moror_6909 [Moniliophthora roreri MCA 2997]|uniref:Uncharacterized protein n=1 Tax=Moniliophthora roreri (strain MCA 2997) TaxID=1381753 RepID=V2XU73_MONRO|nr:hypothetical protein Moror_6909 [Moniliophthora roreri MCA 2997]
MDLDFCLVCQCHYEGPGPYCSRECQPSYIQIRSPSEFDGEEDNDYFTDDVEEPIYHHVEDAVAIPPSPESSSPNLHQHIREWAANIPAGPPPNTPQIPPISTTYPRPKLLSSSQKPMPSLCMSKPDTSSLCNYKQRVASTSSLNIDTLPSPATESSLATPTSTTSPMAFPSKPKSSTILAMVRSWVTPPSHSYSKEIASHFPRSSSPSSDYDDHDDHRSTIWWIPDVPLQDSPLKKSPAQLITKKPQSDATHFFQPGCVPTPRRSQTQLCGSFTRHDLPPYHSRGRKLSRVVA